MKSENKYPPYSVLMSVYYKENPEWLKISIDSMLNQTVLPSEFVLVEDGPLTDELNKVIEQYEKKYAKLFKIVKLEKNQGLGPALKIGVENCTNEYIARIDSDDYSISDRIEKQFKEINKNPKIDIIGSDQSEFIDSIENVISVKKLPSLHEEIVKYARRRNPFSHSSVLFKKEKVLKAGNYREYYYVEDYDLWIRMIQNGCICANVPESLNYVRVSEDLYARRGGIKYLRSLVKFKSENYYNGFYSFRDYIISLGSHIIVCLMPGFLRKFVYTKILRKNDRSCIKW